MSKIICEVCGTSYPDTTAQCPICGCVRPGNARSVSTRDNGEENGGYTYVKGGRFSKANVRKRTGGAATPPAPEKGNGEKSNKGLVITAIVLLLAIIAVIAYIAISFFTPGSSKPEETKPSESIPVQTTQPTAPVQVPCTSLNLDTYHFELEKIGSARLITPQVKPADTTDKIAYTSSDEAVVTVDEKGKVIAVGPGSAIITVTCGSKSAVCTVDCVFELPTEPEETTVPEETEPQEEFRLNREDITFGYQGETWMVYSGNLDPSKIVWTTDNSAVATVANGRITAVGNGQTTIYGEYNGVKVSCIIRCSFSTSSSDSGVGGSDNVFEDGN